MLYSSLKLWRTKCIRQSYRDTLHIQSIANIFHVLLTLLYLCFLDSFFFSFESITYNEMCCLLTIFTASKQIIFFGTDNDNVHWLCARPCVIYFSFDHVRIAHELSFKHQLTAMVLAILSGDLVLQWPYFMHGDCHSTAHGHSYSLLSLYLYYFFVPFSIFYLYLIMYYQSTKIHLAIIRV